MRWVVKARELWSSGRSHSHMPLSQCRILYFRIRQTALMLCGWNVLADYRRVYDFSQLWADCRGPGLTTEPRTLYLYRVRNLPLSLLLPVVVYLQSCVNWIWLIFVLGPIIIIIIIITPSFNRKAWQPQTIYIQYFMQCIVSIMHNIIVVQKQLLQWLVTVFI